MLADNLSGGSRKTQPEPCPHLMTFPNGYTDLPPGKIASVVTYLEIRSRRPPLVPAAAPVGLAVRRVLQPELTWYRNLYRAVGQDWLWFRRLRMSDEDLARAIHDPAVQIYALSRDGDGQGHKESNPEDKGLLELDFSSPAEVEIAYFGLTPDLIGRGAGRYLMEAALRAAWDASPQRVCVHTCTLDHPQALSFYLKAGFVPYKRALEIADDPRLTGESPRTAAPHVPMIE